MSRLGFEPRTLGLKVRCSDQTELPAHLDKSRASAREGTTGITGPRPHGRDLPIADISYHFTSLTKHRGRYDAGSVRDR